MEKSFTAKFITDHVEKVIAAQKFRFKIYTFKAYLEDYKRPKQSVKFDIFDPVISEGENDISLLLSNEVGFDLNKIKSFLEKYDYDISDDDDLISIIHDFTEIGFQSNIKFSDFVFEKENSEIISLLKDIEASYEDFDKKWESKLTYRTPLPIDYMRSELDLSGYTEDMSRYDCMFLKNAFEFDGKSADFLVFLQKPFADDEYELLCHDNFRAFALVKNKPIATINGTIQYTREKTRKAHFFSNSNYYNSKDSMSQFDADFAHYLINACEIGMTQSGNVDDLFRDSQGELEAAIVNVRDFEVLKKMDKENQVNLLTIVSAALFKTLNQSERSVMSFGEDDFDIGDFLSDTALYGDSFKWSSVNKVFAENRDPHLRLILKSEKISDKEKVEEASKVIEHNDLFETAFDIINRASNDETTFVVFKDDPVVNQFEDFQRLAIHTGKIK